MCRILHENELLNFVHIASHPLTLASACGLPLSSTKSLLNAGRCGCSFNSSTQQTWEKDKASNSIFSSPEHRMAVGCESTHGFAFNLSKSFEWGDKSQGILAKLWFVLGLFGFF